jgi:antagonist of KipI
LEGAAMGVTVIKSGLLTTVQDLGRYGYQRAGIIVSGAMDSLSFRLANLLVGNDVFAAGLEVTLVGPTLRFEVDSMIAICGGNFSPTINKEEILLNKPIYVKKGDHLEFGPPKYGSRCYIAFKGGIQIEQVLGSRSTCLPANFGGLNGRALRTGDELPLIELSYNYSFKTNWNLSCYFDSILFNTKPIRVLKGRQYHLFDDESLSLFHSASFSLTKDINRMGYRMDGPSLYLINQQELLTEGVAFGTIQVPANGKPIILMADRQTTGGYPKIAQVISADLPRLAQLKPEDSIHFVEVSIFEAQKLALDLENELKALRKIILAKWKGCGL